ncbi:MAG: hypothetical protein ABJB47_19020, partial [Actinomycetota bacterium]
THSRSRVGHCRDLTVHITTSAQEISRLAKDSAVTLDPVQVQDIEQLITQDHQHYQSRRRPRK